MTPAAFAKACRDIVDRHDGHTAHRQLDSLVTDLLTELGYGEGMAIFIREVRPYHEDLLWRIDQFLARTGMCESRFGREVAGDPKFVSDVRQGRRPLERTSRRIQAFIAKQDAA